MTADEQRRAVWRELDAAEGLQTDGAWPALDEWRCDYRLWYGRQLKADVWTDMDIDDELAAADRSEIEVPR